MIDLRHPLSVLATRMPCTDSEAALAFWRTATAMDGWLKARTCSARPLLWPVPE